MKISVLSFLLLTVLSFAGVTAHAQESANIELEAATPPPALPEYVQPPCPVEGYLWCPGYWAYAPTGYYWVPGVWVRPPHAGLLWTPGYWGYTGSRYGWYSGYWGEHVGYYGGIGYGYGYSGSGYYGGRWEGSNFQYNTYVSTVNTTVVHNTYANNIGINNTVVNHSSFNGEGGVAATPNGEEKAAMKENHVAPTSEQQTHQAAAAQDKKQFFSSNKGKPATTAMNSTDGQRFDKAGKADKVEKEKTEHAPVSWGSSKSTRIKTPRLKKSDTKIAPYIKPARSSSSRSSSGSSSHSSKSKKY